MSDWTPAPDRPGYRCKTVKRENFTAIIYRPILDEAQQAKANEKARRELENTLRQYYTRTARTAAV